MLEYSKTQNYNGSSRVKDAKGNEVIAATMNGSINGDGTLSTNYYISNKEAYNLNKAEVKADIRNFEDIVDEAAEE